MVKPLCEDLFYRSYERKLFAEIKIKGKKLIVDVNSEQRANIVEDFFQDQLSSLLGEPTRLKPDLETLRILQKSSFQDLPQRKKKSSYSRCLINIIGSG